MEPERCHILIVGAGLAGAATAFHLRQAGVAGVIQLEQEAVPGVHASGRNAAILREQMDAPELRDLAAESTAELRKGELAEFHATGGLLLGSGDEPAADHIPCARGRGTYHAADGVMDVAALLQRYLEGQDVRYGVTYDAHHPTTTHVDVETSAGLFRTDLLVNAAGPWAGEIGALPLTPYNRHLFVSAHDPAIDRSWPFLWDLEHEYYLRPESGGWLLSACDERPAEPGDYAQDQAVLEDLGRKLRRHQPDLGDLRIARQWVGQRTFAPDRLPVLGFDARCARLFHVAALGGHGVTLSWAVGRLAAAALAAAAPDDSGPAPWDPARFATARASS